MSAYKIPAACLEVSNPRQGHMVLAPVKGFPDHPDYWSYDEAKGWLPVGYTSANISISKEEQKEMEQAWIKRISP